MLNSIKNMSGTIGIRTIAALVLLGIFTIFIFQNTKVVEIRLLFWELSLSRVILLLGSLFTGILIGLFIGWEAASTKKTAGKRSNL